jgi:hypothetical protein
LPGAPAAAEADASADSLHAPDLMKTITIPGDALESSSLASQLFKIVKANRGLTELRLSFDPVTSQTEAQKIAEIDTSAPTSPRITITPNRNLGILFQAGGKYNIFISVRGIDPFVSEFVNQNKNRADHNEASVEKYVEGAENRIIDPYTGAYKFVFSNPEAGVLEIEITDA